LSENFSQMWHKRAISKVFFFKAKFSEVSVYVKVCEIMAMTSVLMFWRQHPSYYYYSHCLGTETCEIFLVPEWPRSDSQSCARLNKHVTHAGFTEAKVKHFSPKSSRWHEMANSVSCPSITQACEDFAATIIIGEMGYIKCRDSKNVNGFYVSRTYFLLFHIYVIS
jgi:hypothetical protein